MRQSFRTIVVSTLTLIVSSILATAAEVRVLSVGSTQIAARAIATEFEKQTRNNFMALHWVDARRAALASADLATDCTGDCMIGYEGVAQEVMGGILVRARNGAASLVLLL